MNRGRALILTFAILGAAACEMDDDAGADIVSRPPVREITAAESAPEPSPPLQQPQPIEQPLPPGTDREAVERAAALARSEGSEAERSRMRSQAVEEMNDLRFVVDQSDRKLRVYRSDEQLGTYDVAVGTEEHPTPIGDFSFNRVDLNPRWIPPDSEWAKDREPQEPGAPGNPMGRARLIYMMPYTIHGTDALDSLGKAASHGSIRVANEHVIPLAEMLLKAGGSWEGPGWFQTMTRNRTEEYHIPLAQEVPLKIQE